MTDCHGILLLSDFDGTLAASDGTVPERVRQKIAEFTENGGRFTVCTGRTVFGFHAYSPEFINTPVILANGGMIYNYANKTVVRCDGLEEASVPDLRRLCERFPSVAMEFYGLRSVFCIRPGEASRHHFEVQDIAWTEISDPADAEFPCAKIMLAGEPSVLLEVQQFLRERCPALGFLPTTGGMLEILRPGVNKGTALRRLAELLGIAPENVCAIGDGYNDLDMLKAAAVAFVPANGDSLAKACAGQLVCSNDDGAVAEAIERIERLFPSL